MKKTKYFRLIVFSLLFLLFASPLSAQDTLKLSRQACEAIFLEANLLLLAEKLEMPKTEALVMQARLWPNPALSIDEVNLWATQNQLSRFGEELPPLVGSLRRNQQIAISIEQLILTAGKRKKAIALGQVGVEKARQTFEELLRALKLEFRLLLTKTQYLQFLQALYRGKLNSVKQLTVAYQKQMELGNIPRGDYIRLKALELEMTKKLNEYYQAANEAQKELKILMRLPANLQVILTEEGFTREFSAYKKLNLSALIDTAKNLRPDIKLAGLQESYFENLYALEKAMRTPNLTLKGGYDRGGNFMYNFVGFGVGLDLPLFNRNQGNIQVAKISLEQNQLLYQQKILKVDNEIALAYRNLQLAIQFWETIEPNYENTLDNLLSSYTRNFLNRNISLLEYLDFSEAYLKNKTILLEAKKNINEEIENLNYSVGADVLP
jgi:cobalt-zinc-cadmium efflux system outer membrane protein